MQESSSTATLRTLLALSNNGAVRIALLNSGTTDTWAVDNDANADFVVNYVNASGNEFVLDGSGNLTIAGTLTENSDRATKDAIQAVDAHEVLAKLSALPIATWHLKTDAPAVRHMGPMAQDFAAAFGLGADERHIAAVDVGGVALAAIEKALAAK